MPRVRLKDIAEKTNMSIYTVSSALSGRGQISQAKREEVRRVAAEMGYQPNIAGRLLHVRENRDMGLLLLGSSDELRRNVGFADFNLRFMQLCKEAGIRHRTEWFSPQEHPKDLPGLLTEGLVGGVIIAGEPYGAVRQHLAGRLVGLLEGVLVEFAGDDAYIAIAVIIKVLAVILGGGLG